MLEFKVVIILSRWPFNSKNNSAPTILFYDTKVTSTSPEIIYLFWEVTTWIQMTQWIVVLPGLDSRPGLESLDLSLFQMLPPQVLSMTLYKHVAILISWNIARNAIRVSILFTESGKNFFPTKWQNKKRIYCWRLGQPW